MKECVIRSCPHYMGTTDKNIYMFKYVFEICLCVKMFTFKMKYIPLLASLQSNCLHIGKNGLMLFQKRMVEDHSLDLVVYANYISSQNR